MKEGLGLSQLDMQTVCNEVSIGKLLKEAFVKTLFCNHSFQYSTARQR